jgi:Ca2+-binding EF-hand superfamily protein
MVFFVALIMVVPISLMNLVTAVIVEGSFEQATQDKEVAKAYKNNLVIEMMPKIKLLFEKLDTDGSGDISVDEIESAPPELSEELAKCFKTDDMIELFEILDTDQDGKVSIKEFCQELVKVVISERSVDQVRVQKSMIAMRSVVNEIRSDVQSQGTELLRQQAAISAMREDIAAIRSVIAPSEGSRNPIQFPEDTNVLLRQPSQVFDL